MLCRESWDQREKVREMALGISADQRVMCGTSRREVVSRKESEVTVVYRYVPYRSRAVQFILYPPLIFGHNVIISFKPLVWIQKMYALYKL
jgi:hypothetical protein